VPQRQLRDSGRSWNRFLQQLQAFRVYFHAGVEREAGDVAARPRQACRISQTNRVTRDRDDRDCRRRALDCIQCILPGRENNVGFEVHNFADDFGSTPPIAFGRSPVDNEISPLCVAEPMQFLVPLAPVPKAGASV